MLLLRVERNSRCSSGSPRCYTNWDNLPAPQNDKLEDRKVKLKGSNNNWDDSFHTKEVCATTSISQFAKWWPKEAVQHIHDTKSAKIVILDAPEKVVRKGRNQAVVIRHRARIIGTLDRDLKPVIKKGLKHSTQTDLESLFKTKS